MGNLSIWLFYGIPSLFLVVFFLYFLRRPEFKYSFYKVLQCDLMINILCYLNTWISRLCHVELSIPLMIWFNDNFYFLFLFYTFFDSFFYNAQSSSIIVTSTHRLWSSKSTGSNEFWRKHYRKIYAGVVIISGLLALLNIYVGVFRPEYYDHEKQIFVKTDLETIKSSLSTNIFFVKSCFFFIALLIINGLTFYFVCKRFSETMTSATTKRMMRNLTTISVINSLLFFIVMLMPIGVLNLIIDKDFYFWSMVFSDMMSLSLPYILLTCDHNVQKTISKILGIITTSKVNSGQVGAMMI